MYSIQQQVATVRCAAANSKVYSMWQEKQLYGVRQQIANCTAYGNNSTAQQQIANCTACGSQKQLYGVQHQIANCTACSNKQQTVQHAATKATLRRTIINSKLYGMRQQNITVRRAVTSSKLYGMRQQKQQYDVWQQIANCTAVVLYSLAHACLHIYTVYLDNLVSLYCVTVLVPLSSIYHCPSITLHNIQRYHIFRRQGWRQHSAKQTPPTRARTNGHRTRKDWNTPSQRMAPPMELRRKQHPYQ